MAININNKAGQSSIRPVAEVPATSSDVTHQSPRAGAKDEGAREASDVLSVSASFQAKVRSLDQLKTQPPEEENVAIDGELKRMGDMLARMKALSVQAKTVPLNPGQQEQLSSEFARLKNEIQRYSNATRQKGISIPHDPDQDQSQIAASVQQDPQQVSPWVQSLQLTDENSVDSAIESLDTTIEHVSHRSRAMQGIQDRLTAAFTAVASLNPRSSDPSKAISDPSQAIAQSKKLSATLLENPEAAYSAQTNQSPGTALSLLK